MQQEYLATNFYEYKGVKDFIAHLMWFYFKKILAAREAYSN